MGADPKPGDAKASKDNAFSQSEAKRQEALTHINKAGDLRDSGDLHGSDDEVAKAWRALEEALTLCPTNHRARFLLVSCSMNQADYPRAEEEANSIYKALSTQQLKNMGDPLLHLSIAHACKMQNKTDNAMTFAREATELYEHDPQPFMVLGELLERSGDHKEAERYCRNALLKSDSPDCKQPLSSHNTVFTLCCLSASLVRQDQLSEAEKFAIQATHVDSNSTLPLKQLSEVYYHQGRLSEALHIAERAQTIDPDDPDIRERIEATQQGSSDVGVGQIGSAQAASGDPSAASHDQAHGGVGLTNGVVVI